MDTNDTNLNNPGLIAIYGVVTEHPSIYEAPTAEEACSLLSSYVADDSYKVEEGDEGLFNIVRLNHKTQKRIRFGFYATAEEAWSDLFSIMYDEAEAGAIASGDLFGTDKDDLFDMANEWREEQGLARIDFDAIQPL